MYKRQGFTEFDMLKKYRQSFATSELGRLHALFPFSELARQMHLKSSACLLYTSFKYAIIHSNDLLKHDFGDMTIWNKKGE